MTTRKPPGKHEPLWEPAAIRKSAVIPGRAPTACGERVAEEGTGHRHPREGLRARSFGKAPIDIRPANNQQRASKLLEDGSTNAMVGDSPTVAYTVARSNGEIVAVGDPADIRPYGIAVSPMYPELTKATQQAVQQLIDSGVYAQILEKWQIPLGAIKTSEVLYGANPATP
jgi:polar amino acid transport system substrate-binding protein